jgi:hypothetical protein
MMALLSSGKLCLTRKFHSYQSSFVKIVSLVSCPWFCLCDWLKQLAQSIDPTPARNQQDGAGIEETMDGSWIINLRN